MAVRTKRKCHTDVPTGQCNGGNSSIVVPFSYSILVYVKLLIKINQCIPTSSLATGLGESAFIFFLLLNSFECLDRNIIPKWL